MAITQRIAPLSAVLNDSETFYEDIAIRNNSLVTVSFPSINTWSTQANDLAVEVNDKAAQVAAQAVDGGYSQNYINDNFLGVNNAQDITEIKTFTVSPIVPTPVIALQAVNKEYVDNKPSGFKNLIINGAKKVNQSGLINTDNSYNYDNHYKVGDNWFMFIEGLNIESGSEHTLSWVGAATASYYVGTATSSTIDAQTFTDITNGGTITPIITDNQFLWIKFASNSTGDTYNKVQFEKGTVSTTFENRSIGLEEMLVERYYEVKDFFAEGYSDNAGNNQKEFAFRTKKRVSPIVSHSSVSFAGTTNGFAVSSASTNRVILIVSAIGAGMYAAYAEYIADARPY